MAFLLVEEEMTKIITEKLQMSLLFLSRFFWKGWVIESEKLVGN